MRASAGMAPTDASAGSRHPRRHESDEGERKKPWDVEVEPVRHRDLNPDDQSARERGEASQIEGPRNTDDCDGKDDDHSLKENLKPPEIRVHPPQRKW